MKKKFFILVILCTFASYVLAEHTAQEIYKRSSPATAKIIVKDDNDNVLATGTGFLIKYQTVPLLVTNYHVIRAAAKAEAHFSEDRIYSLNEVFAESPQLDIAIVSLNISLTDLSTIYLTYFSKSKGIDYTKGDAQVVAYMSWLKQHCFELHFLEGDLPEIGSKVYVVGSPLGLENTLSEGLISGHRKESDMIWLLTTAPISPGSSGSPLVSTEGQVVGMATSTFKEGQNLNLAVPSSEIIKLVNNPSGAREIWKGTSIFGASNDVYMEVVRQQDREKHPQAELLLKGDGMLVMGMAIPDQKDDEKALTLFKEAARITSKYSYYAHYKSGATLYQLAFEGKKVDYKYLRDAIKSLEKSISLRSDFPPSQFYLAKAYLVLNEYFKASIPANALVNLVPNCHEAYTLRGGIFAELGQKELAFKDFEKALELYPNSESIYFKFGLACMSLNEYLDAISAYKKAIAINDDDVFWTHRFNLGNAYRQAGLYNKAIDEYQKAKELGGDSDLIIKRIADCLLLR